MSETLNLDVVIIADMIETTKLSPCCIMITLHAANCVHMPVV